MGRRTDIRRAGGRLLHDVAATARAKSLFGMGEHVLVCVSGGPDSVALLSLLAQLAPAWRLRLSVVHVDHGLRGEESAGDARFVGALAAEMDLPCVCESVALRHPAAGGDVAAGLERPSSLQQAAREARYAVFRRVGRQLGADRIALGHTADDQAETLLMWMLRGAGTAGLAGIPQAREGVWIRPLLDVSRSRILSWLEESGIAFRMDSSNDKPVYLRNRIRHQLLPLLKDFTPAVVEVLRRQSQILREEDRYLDQVSAAQAARLMDQGPDGAITLDRDGLAALPVALQRRVVRAAVRHVTDTVQGPRFGAVEAILERVAHGRSGSALTVAGVLVSRVYGRLCFQSLRRSRAASADGGSGNGTEKIAVATRLPATLGWPVRGQEVRLSLRERSGGDEPARTASPRATAYLDADRFALPLAVRPWRPGDWFQPAGMHGHRAKLQDFFSDRKVPREERRRVPLLVAEEGILWVGGYRADQRFRATADTRRILVAELVDVTSGREHD